MLLSLCILNSSTLMHDAGRLGNIVKKVVSSLGMSLDSIPLKQLYKTAEHVQSTAGCSKMLHG